MTGMIGQKEEERKLRATIAFAERVNDVEFGEEVGQRPRPGGALEGRRVKSRGPRSAKARTGSVPKLRAARIKAAKWRFAALQSSKLTSERHLIFLVFDTRRNVLSVFDSLMIIFTRECSWPSEQYPVRMSKAYSPSMHLLPDTTTSMTAHLGG
nr:MULTISPECIES: hypothetical protein [unclassified Bradyrhizobium]